MTLHPRLRKGPSTKLVYADSLAGTLDAVADSFFRARAVSPADRDRVARWLAGCQGKAGSYTNLFAPTERDFARGIKLFTGEKVATRAGTAHILGEETCRALLLLDSPDPAVRDALDRARSSILARLRKDGGRRCGTYCCGRCSVAVWHHLSAAGDEEAEAWLARGVKTLKRRRSGDGRWRRFPFHYTLLALDGIDLPAARAEMRYAAPALQRSLSRSSGDDTYTRRRRLLAERALARC